MKKLKPARRLWLDRHSRLPRLVDRSHSRVGQFHWVQAPIIVDIFKDSHRKKLLSFIDKMKAAFKFAKRNDVLMISFRYTEKFIAAGTLLFFSELSRLKQLNLGRGIKFRCTGAANEKANQVLKQIGLFKICGYSSPVVPQADDVVSWNVAHGWSIEPERYAPILEAREGNLAPALLEGVWKGLAEATANAVEHAYIDVRADRLNLRSKTRDWWLFSQEKEGKIFVALCDLGIGISRSLPLTKRGKSLMGRLLYLFSGKPRDCECIKYAVQDSKTRTQLAERGKGLGEIAEAVGSLPGGEVWVYSNKGLYHKVGSKESEYEYSDSILGTLVMWKFLVQQDVPL